MVDKNRYITPEAATVNLVDTYDMAFAATSGDVNPLRFGADPTGVVDSLPSFNAAAATGATATPVIIHLTRGIYNLSATFTGNGRQVTIYQDPGVTFTGAANPALFVQRLYTSPSSTQRKTTINGGSGFSAGTVMGDLITITNNQGINLTGSGEEYTNVNATGSGGGSDIARHRWATWTRLSGSGLAGQWDATVGPLFNTADQTGGSQAGLTNREVNPVNNGPDTAPWTEFDSTKSGSGLGVPSNYAAGDMVVPDNWVPTGGYGGNIQFAWGVFPGQSINLRPVTSGVAHVPTAAAPYYPRSYTGLLIGNRAIAPGGRGVYIGGNTDGVTANNGYTPLETRYTWSTGFRTDLAVFADNNAFVAAAGQKFSFTDGTGTASATGTVVTAGNINYTITPAGTGLIDLVGLTRVKSYTVATLPAAAAGNAGCIAYVTDATAPTYRGALTGGGAVKTLVFSDGSAWTSH